MPETHRGLLSSKARLVDDYDCAMLDLDGVVYIGDRAVGGAVDVLRRARGAAMTLAFVTNNASRSASTVAAHLNDVGVPAEAADVVTSAQAAAHELGQRLAPGAAVLVVGGVGLREALNEQGFTLVASVDDDPSAVVQGFDRSVGWEQLAQAAYAVRAGALWVATNLDQTIPTPAGLAPGNGALVDTVAAATGVRPDVVAGKPYRPLFDETVRRVGARRPIVVGDRLDTDIEGANVSGAHSLLVLTGVTDVDALCRAAPPMRPTFVSWTLDGLLQQHHLPVREHDAFRLGGWRVWAPDGRLEVTDIGEDRDDGLRALAAAAWVWQDDHGLPVSLDELAHRSGFGRWLRGD